MASPYFGLMGAGPDTARRFNLGGPDYYDTQGRLWAGYDNGSTVDYYALGAVTFPPGIGATDDDPLYYTAAYGAPAIVLPVPPGSYSIVAHYCECFNNGPGRLSGLLDYQRATLIPAFDIFNAAGGRNIAYHVAAQRPATALADGLRIYLPQFDGSQVVAAIEATKIA